MSFKPTPIAWVSFAMVVGVMGTALISPLYALYKDLWHLQASDISLIYVVYMAGALCALLSAGRLPDRLGFLPLMRAGLALAMFGTFMSLLAWNVASLTGARFLVGVASSLMVTSATAGLYRLSPPQNLQRMSMVSSFLLAAGFGVGPLVGGVFGQWAPAPLVTAYLPTLVLGAVGWMVLGRLRLGQASEPTVPGPLHWRDLQPKLTWPERELSKVFVLTTCLPFLAFGVFGLYASMAPLFLDKLLPWHGPVVSGTAIALILFVSAGVQVLVRRMPTPWCGFAGLLALAASNAALMLNLMTRSPTLFALGLALTAAGHGMSMLAGMSMLPRLATPAKRAGLMSTYMVVGYIGSMLPMTAVGWIADHWGLETGVRVFCGAAIVFGVGAGVLFRRNAQRVTEGMAS